MASMRVATIMRHLQGSASLRPNQTSATAPVTSAAKDFVYTMDNWKLSYEQRKFYEENGFVVIPHLVPDEVLDHCCRRFVDLCEGRVPKGPMVLMKDISLAKTSAKGEYLYNKVQDFVWDEVLSRYILLDELLDYVECFVGPNMKAVHTMLINKPPDSGKSTSQHPLHQDLHYFPFRPENRIVACWTAMEKVTVDNGCLVVIPGSHKGPLHHHDYPQWENGVNKAYHGIKGYENHPVLNLEMEKGDTVFFHPLLIHGSGVNRTKGFRKAISCHYAASDCYYIDVMGTSQENIAKEVVEMARRKGLDGLDFKMVWQYRSRLARGQEGTL